MLLMWFSQFLLLQNIVFVTSDNVLLTTPWSDSIVYPNILLDIASLLADHGHNVTFLALDTDDNIPDNIRYLVGNVSRTEKILQRTEYLHEVAEASGALAGPSSRLITQSIVGSNKALEVNIEQLKIRFDYLMSKEVEDIIRAGNFSLIIADETAFHPIALQTRKLMKQNQEQPNQIPIITVLSIADQHRSRIEQNLPTLLTSEAGQFLNLYTSYTPPDFNTRLTTLWEIGYFAWQVVPRILSLFTGYLEEAGVGSLTELDNMTSLYLVNDHPAISFSNLAPPNSVNIASLNFKTPRKVPQHFTEFVEECGNRRVVMVVLEEVAYKSRLKKINQTVGKLILESLQKEGFCVVGQKLPSHFINDQTFNSANLPVENILGSGMVSLFICQCGNKQRIQGVLYQVPMLCVPLFADQFSNSVSVVRNQFGAMLMREEMSEETSSNSVKNVLEQWDDIKANLARSASAVLDDPNGSKQAVLFYCNYLLKFGNADYLKNKVIMKQSVIQVYNLDILGLLTIILVVLGCFLFILMRTSFKFCGWFIQKKLKSD
ncbi:UDP-glucuronosyltransferase 3A1-like [Bolinopsis microptera]|uniref:UDP-glucuronosyltransferase 3A1-like n=1 Tax=Bolinopsis microptera TaxID=2820187 RepID=UPI003079068E